MNKAEFHHGHSIGVYVWILNQNVIIKLSAKLMMEMIKCLGNDQLI